MPMFTIYLCREDGVAAAFEMHIAHSDGQALAMAELILEQHPTAAYANVWEGERKIGRVDRSEDFSRPYDGSGATE